MKVYLEKVFLCLFIVMSAAVLSSAQTTDSAPDEVSSWQAQRALAVASRYSVAACWNGWTGWHHYSIDFGSFQFSSGDLAATATNYKGKAIHLRKSIKNPSPYIAKCEEETCWLVSGDSPKADIFKMRGEEVHEDCTIHLGHGKSTGDRDRGPSCSEMKDVNRSECVHSGEWFAAALNRLRVPAPEAISAADFHQKAAAWRSLASKPPLSETVNVHRLMGEDAVKRQKPYDALNHYELGVDADPTWATGWYNAAVLAAELGYYADAAHHIQNYLELMPESSEAQAARDNLAIWKYKAGRAAK